MLHARRPVISHFTRLPIVHSGETFRPCGASSDDWLPRAPVSRHQN
jgi:hypothetical protein